MESKTLSTLVLAAGKGTRMKSKRAKVLHEVFFKPMIHHVLEAVKGLPICKNIVVTGHQAAEVENSLHGYDVVFAHQKEQLGTGHAVRCAEEILRDIGGAVMILCGDTPLVRPETLAEMYDSHEQSAAKITLMITVLKNPQNYGRVISDEDGHVLRIVEEKDASEPERRVEEINAGIYCVDVAFLCDALHKINTDNKQGEFYLTDIIEIASSQGQAVNKHVCDDPLEVLGVNSRNELAIAHRHLQKRRNVSLMAEGVTMLAPDTVFVEDTVKISTDVIISANVFITGTSIIGSGCRIEPFCVIHNSSLRENIVVGPFAKIVGSDVETNHRSGEVAV